MASPDLEGLLSPALDAVDDDVSEVVEDVPLDDLELLECELLLEDSDPDFLEDE